MAEKAQPAVEAMAFEEEGRGRGDDEEVIEVEEPAAIPDTARHRVLQRCMALRLICGSGPRP